MSKLVWDATGERLFETGLSKGVLFPMKEGQYQAGVPWNGLTAVTSAPAGAEPTDLWADDMKYAVLRSAETYGCTIEAYMYPDEFIPCDGGVEEAAGLRLGQQSREPFGFCYQTRKGSDTDTDADGYIIHIVYNGTASPSERNYQTSNDSPEAITMSWEVSTTPIAVEGHKPLSTIDIDSTKADKTKLAALEAKLYGSEDEEATLPSPEEIIAIFKDEV